MRRLWLLHQHARKSDKGALKANCPTDALRVLKQRAKVTSGRKGDFMFGARQNQFVCIALVAFAMLTLATYSPISAAQEERAPSPSGGNFLAQYLTAGLLIFSLAVLFLVAYLLKHKANPEMVLRVFGIILIILMAAFLVAVDRPMEDLAPVVGLLGTVAGYLMGKTERSA